MGVAGESISTRDMVVLSGKTKGSIVSTRKRCVFSKKGMFTRLSLNFGKLELPNQNRHGWGGAGLARTATNGVYFRRRWILAVQSEEKNKKEGKKESKWRSSEKRDDRRE